MSNSHDLPSGRRPLDGDELADLEAKFAECDVDGDQCIDFAEFSLLLDSVGSEVPVARRRGNFDAIDLNHDGVVDQREFIEWLRCA